MSLAWIFVRLRTATGVDFRTMVSVYAMADDLAARLVCAVVEELRDDDRFVLIGVGERELRISWESDE